MYIICDIVVVYLCESFYVFSVICVYKSTFVDIHKSQLGDKVRSFSGQ